MAKKVHLVPVGWWAEGVDVMKAIPDLIEGPLHDLGHATGQIEINMKEDTISIRCSKCGLVGNTATIERQRGRRTIKSAIFSGELFMVGCIGTKRRVRLGRGGGRLKAMRGNK